MSFMEFHNSLPALSSYHPGHPEHPEDRSWALRHANGQAVSHNDDAASSNSMRILGATKRRRDSDIFSCEATNVVDQVPRGGEDVTRISSLGTSCFAMQSASPPGQVTFCSPLSDTNSTSLNERTKHSTSSTSPSPRSEVKWPDEVEEAFQKGPP